jgi:dihydroflavonol-4-reductase
LKKMTTLVTGATGFVGSAIVRCLLDDGHDVRALVRPSSDLRNLENISVDVVHGDLTDPLSVKKAMDGCEYLFHVAADYRLWVPDPESMYRNNVQGTRNVMFEALRSGIRKVIYTSSVATLALSSNGKSCDEASCGCLEDMIGHYKRSKFLAEGLVQQLIEECDLPAVIVSPSTPVGPRDIKPTATGRIILDAISGRIPAYVNTGLNIVHVNDVAEGHKLALEKGTVGERYILGGENMSLREILKELAAINGHNPPRFRMPHSAAAVVACVSEACSRISGGGEPRVTRDGVKMARKYMFFSSGKARQDLGYHPRPVKEGLSEAVAWFRDNGYCD